MSECFKPFFSAASELSENGDTQYYLGFRKKSPGMDLVLFRFDGIDQNQQPKGHGAIFHYAGFIPNDTASIPKLVTVHNIRNTLLFNVSSEEFKAAEGFIDMLRENGFRNPYYFSRQLNVSTNKERQGEKPLMFDGSENPKYREDPCDHFERASDSIPVVGINCAYLSIEILQTIVGVNLSNIHQDLPSAWTGSLYDKVYREVCSSMVDRKMPKSLNRKCMIFDEQETLLATYDPSQKASNVKNHLQAA